MDIAGEGISANPPSPVFEEIMITTLLQQNISLFSGKAGPSQAACFWMGSFQVKEGCIGLTLTARFDCGQAAQLPFCLFDPEGKARLMKAGQTVTNETVIYKVGETESSSGCLSGPMPAGVWKMLIYKRRMKQDARLTLTVLAEYGQPIRRAEKPIDFDTRCLEKGSRWYQGELHTHSQESTGQTPVADVIAAARACGLDYLALTDHFTAAHWPVLDRQYDGQKPLLLRSMEVSGDRGHMNLHGLSSWMLPLVDDNREITEFLGLTERPTMQRLAEHTHAQGGLVCINHPLSGEVGWRYPEFDLRQADLVEIWCMAERDATLAYPAFYDMLLAKGLRLTAVGSSDSHHPTKPGPWQLGQVRTFIYAEALSQQALLDGLKAGHAYISVSGGEMEMTAACGDTSVMMGDELAVPENGAAALTVTLNRHPKGNLYLYRDGLLEHCQYISDESPITLTFPVRPAPPGSVGYLRAEFYEIEGERPYYGYSWRSWQTLRLLSNPIYLRFVEGGRA